VSDWCSCVVSSIHRSLLGSRATVVRTAGRAGSISHSWLSIWLLWWLSMLHIWLHVLSVHWSALGWVADLSTVVVGVGILTSSGLGYVWLDRHATRNDIGCRPTPGGILRRSGATEALGELFAQRLSDVVHRDMDRIRYTKYHKRALTRIR
jgi:hypothetical protein